MDTRTGRRFGHYEVLDKLGEGGMGVVYRARDLDLQRDVALKFPTDRVVRDRFLQEARAASALDHLNICTIFEVGETPDHDPFIAMALYAGETLNQMIARGPVSIGRALDIALQVARGLQSAHARGVVHRDIKPSNLILTDDGVVKILDFGLARAARDERTLASRETSVGTVPGTVLGTIGYLSPEQARGEAADARSDLWSLGVVLYELLAGEPPFAANNVYAVMDAILRVDPKPLYEVRPRVPVDISAVVSRALRKAPEDRYQDAKSLLIDLQAAVAQIVSDTPTDEALDFTPFSAPRDPSTHRETVRPSLAVLPFANLSSDVENEYFSDGLTDELINALSQLRGLKVVSRTSSFEFKNKPLSARRIGEQLGVSALLEGSVRRSGERLRVTAQLVNVEDGCQRWAGRFDRKMTDVFAIQDEIAQTIAGTLAITLSGLEGRALVKRYTKDLDAYHLYLKGRFHWNKRTPEGFTKAREYFEAALARDPEYAPAYSGLADFHMSVAAWGLAPPAESWAEAKAAALKALKVDPHLAEAHTSLAVYRTYGEWDWDEGEREFARARQLSPNDTNTCFLHATCLIQRGRLSEARAEMERAFELDPLSATINTYLAGVAHYARAYDESIELCRKALELAPQDVELLCVLALNYEQKGSFDEALATFQQARDLSGGHPLVLGAMGATYARAGRVDEYQAIHDELAAMASERYVPPIAWAWMHIARGQDEQAFDWLDRAADDRDCLLCYLGVGPTYDSLRAHPRYGPLLSRIGLAESFTAVG